MKKEEEHVGFVESIKITLLASRAFWIVNLVSFGDGIAYFGILTLLTRYLGTDLGLGVETASLAVSCFTGLVTLSVLGGGWVSDKLGVRKALLLSLAVILGGRVVLAMCPGLGTAAGLAAWLALIVMALGYGLFEPSVYSGVKEYTDPRTATIGYGLIYSIMNLGIVVENFISPYLRTEEVFFSIGGHSVYGLGLGIDGVYWICAGVTLIMFLGVLCFLTKKVDERDRYKGPDNKEKAKEQQAEPADETWKDRLRRNLGPLYDKRFLFFIFILLPVRTLFAHQFLTMPDYIFRCYTPQVSAKFEWLAGLNPLIISICVPLVAALTKKVKVLDMMLIGTTVSALTTFLLVPGPEAHRLILYVILFSLGEALWASRFLEYVADLAPSGKVGAYMGLAGLPWFLAKFTTGLYSGRVLNYFVPEGGVDHSGQMWLCYAFIAMISPVALFLARGWLQEGERSEETEGAAAESASAVEAEAGASGTSASQSGSEASASAESAPAPVPGEAGTAAASAQPDKNAE
ncbi:MFS transporter [bacterium]|nr:MFS transporter [bacterium]